jgi:hypothetical protein
VCAFISAIKIQTTEPISVKFGIGMLLNAGTVRSWVASPYPDPLKLKSTFILLGADHILDLLLRFGTTWTTCISGAVVNLLKSCLITLM